MPGLTIDILSHTLSRTLSHTLSHTLAEMSGLTIDMAPSSPKVLPPRA